MFDCVRVCWFDYVFYSFVGVAFRVIGLGLFVLDFDLGFAGYGLIWCFG